jgi:hypothetical protein
VIEDLGQHNVFHVLGIGQHMRLRLSFPVLEQ